MLPFRFLFLMAIQIGGVLGPIYGRLGPGYFRGKDRRYLNIYHMPFNDRRSLPQSEQRRRFQLTTKYGSKIYLSHLKPLEYYYATEYNAIADFVEQNIPTWYEFWGEPRLRLVSYYVTYDPFITVRLLTRAKKIQMYWGAPYEVPLLPDDKVRLIVSTAGADFVYPDPGTFTGPSGEWLLSVPQIAPGVVLYMYALVLRKGSNNIYFPYKQLWGWYRAR